MGALTISIVVAISGYVQHGQDTSTVERKNESRFAANVRWWQPDNNLKVANASPAPIYAIEALVGYIGVFDRAGRPLSKRIPLVGVIEPCVEFTIESSIVAETPATVEGIYFVENDRSWFRDDKEPTEQGQPSPSIMPSGLTRGPNSSVSDIPACSRSG
jgi:hypothetical protein